MRMQIINHCYKNHLQSLRKWFILRKKLSKKVLLVFHLIAYRLLQLWAFLRKERHLKCERVCDEIVYRCSIVMYKCRCSTGPNLSRFIPFLVSIEWKLPFCACWSVPNMSRTFSKSCQLLQQARKFAMLLSWYCEMVISHMQWKTSFPAPHLFQPPPPLLSPHARTHLSSIPNTTWLCRNSWNWQGF